MKKILVAVTGASGAIYARQTIDLLCRVGDLEQIGVVVSRHGREVMDYEGERLPSDPRIRLFDNEDLFAPPASGSADYEAMVVVPCSMGSVGRMAAGVSADLIGRAADVMLKERRPLVLVVRETPLSTIHLRNLTTLSECGAVVLPAAPALYARPQEVEALCATVSQRVLRVLGLPVEGFRWGGEQE